MEKRLALRLCLFGAPGLCSCFNASSLLLGALGGGCDAEWECEGSFLLATGEGGFWIGVSGSGASHISQAVRFGSLRKVHRGHCFLRSGVDGLWGASGSTGGSRCGRGG
jgi:hypothetical protein